MKIHISGHGVGVSPALRRRVEAKVAKVTRFLPKVAEARVVLSLERYRHVAEVTLQAKGATLHAEGAASDFHTATDAALASLETQVRRRKDRIQARKPRAGRRTQTMVGAVPEAGPVDDGPSLVIRRLAAKPMSLDEALEQIRIREDGLLVFTNARSRVVNVLRRHADGQLELVQPTG